MEKLAESILNLGWSDMDAFASHIVEFATDDEGRPDDERYIAQCLIDFANDLLEPEA